MQATSMSAALGGCSMGAAYANNAPEQSGAGLYVQVDCSNCIVEGFTQATLTRDEAKL